MESSDQSVDLSKLDPHSLDTGYMLVLPEAGTLYEDRNISFVTEDIKLQVLYSAYMQGVFPWFCEDEGDPVVWYCPDPRFCIQMNEFHVPKSIDRFLKHSPYTYTYDKAFDQVIKECRNMERPGQNGTWIGGKIIDAYCSFHEAGFAHSVEVWENNELVGGLYGVLIGSVFCGESMFTKASDSAKSAFVLFARAFAECGGLLIDSQVYTDNIARYGAKNISRDAFLRLENEALRIPLKQSLEDEFYKIVRETVKN